MLKLLRNKKTAKKIWIVLAIMILPAFLFWGLGSVAGDKNEKGFIGKMAGRKISALEHQEALSAIRNTAIMQYGERFAEIEKNLDLEALSWQRLALLQEAKRLKIKAADQEVIRLIESYPFFQYKGSFDNRAYNDALKYVFRTQPRVFEEQTRQNIILSKLYRQVTEGVSINEADLRAGYLKIKSSLDPKFQMDEKKFLSEKKDFEPAIREEKKQEYFSKFIAGLLK